MVFLDIFQGENLEKHTKNNGLSEIFQGENMEKHKKTNGFPIFFKVIT